MNRNSHPGLLLGGTLLVAAAALAFAARGAAGLQLLVAIPLVLLAPGFALTSVAFGPGRLGFAERALLSVGGSLVAVVLGGLALALTPWGLRPATWAAYLGGITVGAGLLALGRWRDRLPASPFPAENGGLGAAQALICLLAVVVAAGALLVTVRGAEGQKTVGFTQLWLVDSSPGDVGRVRLGLQNHEPAATTFRLQFEVDGQLRRTWTRALEPEQTWEETIALPTDLPATATIEAVLYRADSPDLVYRRVALQRGQR